MLLQDQEIIMTSIDIKSFYKDVFQGEICKELDFFLNEDHQSNIGHFNIFEISALINNCKTNPKMPYNRRTYYKISLINGANIVEYADKVVEVSDYAVLFASPKIPYRYTSKDTSSQSGYFCVFTENFLSKANNGVGVDDFPIFKPHSDFVYQINKNQYEALEVIFKKMQVEISSEYSFKYDLLRNYVIELIHTGQKLQPMLSSPEPLNASSRITTMFIELLERQFPVETPNQVLKLRTAKDYADTLLVHVNHLNKVLKETTGKTTTEIITSRLAQEAKMLLKHTTWTISEIAFSLGYEDLAHFSNFFKKQTSVSPQVFRN